MEIAIEFHGDQFNVNLSSKPGAEAFLSIKGCRLVDGDGGQFIGYPATKNTNTGKWWRHAGRLHSRHKRAVRSKSRFGDNADAHQC